MSAPLDTAARPAAPASERRSFGGGVVRAVEQMGAVVGGHAEVQVTGPAAAAGAVVCEERLGGFLRHFRRRAV
jgi:hypothetical protein